MPALIQSSLLAVWFQNKRAKTKINEVKEGVPLEHRTTVSRTKLERTVSASEAQGRKRRQANEAGQLEQAGERGCGAHETQRD